MGKVCLSKCFYLSIFTLSSGTSTNPYFPLRRVFLLLYAIFIFIWVSILSYKAPTKGHYDRTWALGVVNIRVCFKNGSMIEHDGLGITYFNIDILKHMVACWYAWVFMSHVKTRLLLWTLAPLQIPTSLYEGSFFYFMQFLFWIWVSIFSYKSTN